MARQKGLASWGLLQGYMYIDLIYKSCPSINQVISQTLYILFQYRQYWTQVYWTTGMKRICQLPLQFFPLISSFLTYGTHSSLLYDKISFSSVSSFGSTSCVWKIKISQTRTILSSCFPLSRVVSTLTMFHKEMEWFFEKPWNFWSKLQVVLNRVIDINFKPYLNFDISQHVSRSDLELFLINVVVHNKEILDIERDRNKTVI